jgi:MFS family permease
MALPTTATFNATATGKLDLDEKVPGESQAANPDPASPVEKDEQDEKDESQQQPTSLSPSINDASTSIAMSKFSLPTELPKPEPGGSPVMPGPPPDGGLQAWLQVLVAHLVIFNTWGYINSFGVFQTYYIGALDQSPSDISWIGSVQVFLLFFIGTFSGRATDAGYFRHTFVFGTILILLGVFMASLYTEYWQLFLAQGICTGIGNGLLFCPTLALLPTYFTKNRAMAVGLAASGTTTGGMIIPGIFEALLPRVGFGWTLRVLGLIMLVFQLIAFALGRTRVPPRSIGPLVEFSAFKEIPYLLFAIGIFFCFWGVYPAYYYVGEYASSVIRVSQGNSINLLIIMNGIGIIGRLVPPYFSDKCTGPANMMIPFVLLSAISLYCWAAIFTQGGLFAFATIYGLFSSGVNSLFPTALSSLTTDMTKMGVRMGMIFTVISFATLTGTPIAGALISTDGGNYLGMEMFSASLLMIGAIMLVAARISRTGWKLKVRV